MGRLVQRLLAAVLGVTLGLVAAEFGFRYLLFGEVPGYVRPGSAMQQREQAAQPLSSFQRRLREPAGPCPETSSRLPPERRRTHRAQLPSSC